MSYVLRSYPFVIVCAETDLRFQRLLKATHGKVPRGENEMSLPDYFYKLTTLRVGVALDVGILMPYESVAKLALCVSYTELLFYKLTSVHTLTIGSDLMMGLPILYLSKLLFIPSCLYFYH